MRRATLFCLASLAVVIFASIATPAEPNGGAVEHSVTVDGISRNYLVFAPKRFDKPLPMVLALHGGGSNARQMERYTRFNDLAAKEGFLVVYPEAVDGNWNDGRGIEGVRAQQENIDDVKFVRTILDCMSKEHKIDRSRVFCTGISNGAFMSHRLATEASDVITAIAPVVGGMAPAMAKKFHPDQPVSILIIQGDADPLVPVRGGMVGFPRGRKRGQVIPTEETISLYLRRNGNQGDPTVTTLDRDEKDGTSVEIRRYPDGPGGVKTQVYIVRNGGHTWAGRPLYLPEMLIGKASQEFSATEVIWEFFKSYPPRQARSGLKNPK
ncbi:MAG: PHB depolymerase family esterase [Isosphaeraceae bacterium]